MYFEKKDFSDSQMIELIKKIEKIEVSSFKRFENGLETNNILINNINVYRFSFMSYNNPRYASVQGLIENEIKFANYLFNKGINSFKFSLFCKNYYEKIYLIDGVLFILKYNYIIGEECPSNKENIIKIAKKISLLHNTLQKKEIRFNKIDHYIAAMDYRTPRFNTHISKEIELYKYYFDLYNSNKIELKNMKMLTEEIFIHNDLKKDNIIINKNIINLIDFGDCRYSNRSEDIGTYFWGVSYEYEELDNYNDIIKLFLKTYILSSFISSTEIEMIYRYAIDRFLNINLYYLDIHKTTNNIKKYNMQMNKFKKEIKYIDYFIRKISEEVYYKNKCNDSMCRKGK